MNINLNKVYYLPVQLTGFTASTDSEFWNNYVTPDGEKIRTLLTAKTKEELLESW
ncbi:hypothetical protein [Streptococcus catagoni]|uniref:hypothetical protein n=1 Tax=Streptococcus catagoni TaxID=2654874 RepID=UPI00140A8AC8|nr:hypothetical protein [Streptococcus catagoni]